MKDSERLKCADILWERLVERFNAEAATYVPEDYASVLGSIGSVGEREVCRPDWWKALGGEALIGSKNEDRGLIILGKGKQDGFDDYWAITHLIEEAHHGEQLATGRIFFGS
ncbi:MAG: hypothetical protein LBI13_07855 [Streptococcaceae bacterium]|jgi:hypothetical protein|nr:hypothetical protein [Streptococcaceae bacterium]